MNDIRVLVVADDSLARAGLAALLAGQDGCLVAGQVAASADPTSSIQVFAPDVVLLELGWDEGGLEHLPDWTAAGRPVAVLLSSESTAAGAWTAGARALLYRDSAPEALAAAFAAITQGQIVLDSRLAASVVPARDHPEPPPSEDLTPREREVLRLMAEGLPNKLIADRLGVSAHTVKFHVNAILAKLGVQSRTEAVVRASRLGLILL